MVSGPDGAECLRAPLARQARRDAEDEGCVWVRPVVGGARPACGEGGPPWRFSLSLARRRALAFAGVRTEGADVVFALRSGEVARVRPIGADLRGELERWDGFVLLALPPDVERALERLEEDSWHGEWA